MRIVLTGFMGTGKSAVARQLAVRLKLQCVDLDQEIEARAGLRVAEIFDREGETVFRALERDVLQQVCMRDGIVLALGGGAIADEVNFERLAQAGAILVRLEATPAEIVRRVRPTLASRPLLRGHPDLEARVRELLAARAAIYARVPLVVCTEGLSPRQSAERVASLVAKAAANAVRHEGLRGRGP